MSEALGLLLCVAIFAFFNGLSNAYYDDKNKRKKQNPQGVYSMGLQSWYAEFILMVVVTVPINKPAKTNIVICYL